jgi:hypothetical protein
MSIDKMPSLQNHKLNSGVPNELTNNNEMTCLTVGLEQLVENEAEEAKQYGK